jgi:CheY-like chemotaxis protein
MAACRVLVAEDDEDLRRSFAMILQSQGFETEAVADGAQALERLRSRKLPNVVLLDLHMPVMDGYEFLRRKNEDPQLNQVPVIAITGQSFANPTGVVATLKKPFDIEEFLRAVADGCR